MTPDISEIKRIVCEKVRVNCRQAMARRMIEDANIDVVCDHIADALIFQMESFVQALPDQRISIHKRWPKTWWDAFKDRWFPVWAKHIWPVKFETISVEERTFKAVCPHLDMPREEHVSWMFQHDRTTSD